MSLNDVSVRLGQDQYGDKPKMTTLYYYCRTDVGHSILEKAELRLNLLTLTNDFSEGKLFADALSHLADRERIEEFQKAILLQVIRPMDFDAIALGMCFSFRKNLLSQWREYADGGRGVCIGFNKEYLEAQCNIEGKKHDSKFRLQPVMYKLEEHIEIVAPFFQKFRELVTSRNYDKTTKRLTPEDILYLFSEEEPHPYQTVRYLEKKLEFFAKIFQLKDEAFSAEDESRLIETDTGVRKGVKFHANGGRLIPYRPFSLKRDGKFAGSIDEVWLGPKHETPAQVVEQMLMSYGYNKGGVDGKMVEVIKSDIALR